MGKYEENCTGARREGLVRLSGKKSGRCPQNKQTPKSGRSLNARQRFWSPASAIKSLDGL